MIRFGSRLGGTRSRLVIAILAIALVLTACEGGSTELSPDDAAALAATEAAATAAADAAVEAAEAARAAAAEVHAAEARIAETTAAAEDAGDSRLGPPSRHWWRWRRSLRTRSRPRKRQG